MRVSWFDASDLRRVSYVFCIYTGAVVGRRRIVVSFFYLIRGSPLRVADVRAISGIEDCDL